jgi:hypothetical protein
MFLAANLVAGSMESASNTGLSNYTILKIRVWVKMKTPFARLRRTGRRQRRGVWQCANKSRGLQQYLIAVSSKSC